MGESGILNFTIAGEGLRSKAAFAVGFIAEVYRHSCPTNGRQSLKSERVKTEDTHT